MKHYEGIDFLRGTAVLGVVVYHFFVILNLGNLPLFPYIHYLGLFGVSLFFVISGFLVYSSFSALYKKYNQDIKLSLKKYFINRAFRILPAYYFSFLIVLLLASFTIDANYLYSLSFMKQILSHLSLTSYFIYKDSGLGFNGAYWTLNIEMLWYLVVPIIVLYADKTRLIVIAIIVSFFMFYFLDVIYENELFNFTKSKVSHLFYYSFQLFPQFVFFGLGVLIYKYNIKLAYKKQSLNFIASFFTMFVFILLSKIGIDTFLMRNIVLFFVAFILFTLLYNQKFGKFCFISWLGKISYSIYLWHFIILVIMNKSGILNLVSLWSTVVLYTVFLLTISSMSYYFIEEKGLDMKNKL
ncbi:MAG: acyltransferase [Sulfurimonas sp.]|uniref:acyltransferase family protein n=1 Tax=Sulfurimonas sp. TaxID=2022749 RepID=UPI00263109EF|nr:acyltransferase [Sulfurimonas sp.]MDD5373388.1 acyltransferase [Sulfurimonas sp.]